MHHAFDVFDHNNGVIDQKTNRQHHAKHGQRVDRISERRQNAKRTKQNHRHRNRRDQGRAPVLQEHEHHDEDKRDGFKQGPDHFLDRNLDERGRIIRINNFHPLREERFKLLKAGFHRLGSVKRIGPGRKVDTDTGSGLCIIPRNDLVAFATDLDARHIAQTDLRTIRIHTQQNIGEFVNGRKLALRRNRRVDLLARHGWRTADLTGRDFRVLRFDCRTDIGNRQVIGNQLVRIEPDAHRMLRTKHLNRTDTVHTCNRVFDGRYHKVRKVFGIHRTIGRHKARHHKERTA